MLPLSIGGWIFILAAGSIANWQVVETWHHGSLFARTRAWLEVRSGLLPELMLCPYCLSHWTALPITAAAAVGVGSAVFNDLQWLLIPVISLAVTRLSNLLNDVCRPVCRTPGRHDSDADLLEEIANAEKVRGGGAGEAGQG